MEFNVSGKNVLVCGAAKSGLSAAQLLINHGANVTVQDLKQSGLEKESEFLESIGAKILFGENPDEILGSFDLVVVSPGIPTNLPFFKKADDLDLPLISEFELAYLFSKGDIIAITGTNGKTTTTCLVYEIFKNYNKNTELVGNVGIPFSSKADLSTDFIVAEVSSFQLETIEKFHPKIAACLNITPDHLNRHKTLENYILMKERIFENQQPEDFLVLNYDDEVCRKMALKTKSTPVFFSRLNKLKSGVYLDDKEIVYAKDEEHIKILHISELNIFGNHSLENAMAAVAIAICANIPLEIIRTSLKEFQAVEHRIEFVAKINEVSYYNDSKATNTDAAIKALDAMTSPVLLIAGGQDKGADYSEWVAMFNDKVKFVAVIGETSDTIIETCRAFNFNNIEKANSLKTAVELCYNRAEKGDVVLLSPACASWDMFDNYEQRGKMFKSFVKEL